MNLWYQSVANVLKNQFLIKCLNFLLKMTLSHLINRDLKHGDFCTNQLLAITHGIYKSFDEDFKVRGVFLYISKAFDKVWHERFI